jgi:hypothetical protein
MTPHQSAGTFRNKTAMNATMIRRHLHVLQQDGNDAAMDLHGLILLSSSMIPWECGSGKILPLLH